MVAKCSRCMNLLTNSLESCYTASSQGVGGHGMVSSLSIHELTQEE